MYSGEADVVGATIAEAAVVVGGAVVVSGAAGFAGVRITLCKRLLILIPFPFFFFFPPHVKAANRMTKNNDTFMFFLYQEGH